METKRWEAIDIFDAGVAAAAPPRVLPQLGLDASGRAIHVGTMAVPADGLRRAVVVGAGKAAAGLCTAVVDALLVRGPPGCHITALALVPESPALAADPFAERPIRLRDGLSGCEAMLDVVTVRPPDANAPTAAAVVATERAVALVRGARDDTLVICAFTGGGSATLCAPAPGLTLAAKHEAVRLLTSDGATIAEINTLRRHLSAVKGGRLAQAASGARAVVSFLMSDVDDDEPHVIASGPTVPDPTTYRDAIDLREEWPPEVLAHLQAGCRGQIRDTPKTLPPNVSWEIVRSPDDALLAAAELARDRGWHVRTLPRPTPSRMEACVAAHLDAIRAAPDRTAILSIGEAPLELPSRPPQGGRAGHLALALAIAADADPALRDRVTVLVGATDGEDGSSGTSGAVVDSGVLRRAEAAGLDPAGLLERCDSLRALVAGAGVLPRRVTGTNVQDLRAILVYAAPTRETG